MHHMKPAHPCTSLDSDSRCLLLLLFTHWDSLSTAVLQADEAFASGLPPTDWC